MEMNKKTLRQICRDHDLYQTAELNDKLYLHYKGFASIDQSINEYSNLLCLYLEGNCLHTTEGLNQLTKLKCLYLQENAITTISLSNPVLSTLNVNQNIIQSISQKPLKQCLPELHTLSISKNKITTMKDLEALRDHPTLSVLDLSNNRLGQSINQSTDDIVTLESLLSLLKTLPSLKVLYLKGNEFLSSCSNYRKSVIGNLTGLTYLDDRPVFEDERRMTDAWLIDGLEGEKKVLQEMRSEREQKQHLQWKQFDDLFGNQSTNQSNHKSSLDSQFDEKMQLSEQPINQPTNQSTSQFDDSEDEIGAHDDVDSDDESNISKVEDYLYLLGKKDHQPTNQSINRLPINQSLHDIDEVALSDRKPTNQSTQHPTEAWAANQSTNQSANNIVYQSKRAIIEVIDDDEEHALVDQLD